MTYCYSKVRIGRINEEFGIITDVRVRNGHYSFHAFSRPEALSSSLSETDIPSILQESGVVMEAMASSSLLWEQESVCPARADNH